MALAMIGTIANSASPMPSAADCRDEAISTGLEQDAAIQAYVEQCMQRYAGLTEYHEITSRDDVEPPVEERMVESEPAN